MDKNMGKNMDKPRRDLYLPMLHMHVRGFGEGKWKHLIWICKSFSRALSAEIESKAFLEGETPRK